MNIKNEINQALGFIKCNERPLSFVATILISLLAIKYLAIDGVFSKLLLLATGELIESRQLTHLIAWSGGCILFYLVVPTIVLLVRKEKLLDFGWDFRSAVKHLPLYLMLFLPIGVGIFFAAGQDEFQNLYPFYHNPSSWKTLLLWELLYGLQFVSLEFFFRGFIIHGLKKHFGQFAAVVIMTLPYMMIHFPKPGLEACCAVIFGIILAIASLRTGTILGGILLHLTIAMTMDLSALYHSGWFY